MRRFAISFAKRLRARVTRRLPDQIIGGGDDPYLRRWYVIPRNRFFNIYLHHFMRSDDDRALHDHPWANASFVFDGYYFEHTIRAGGIHYVSARREGTFAFRRAKSAHRVSLPEARTFHVDNDGYVKIEKAPASCWTIFITGPRIREWGFHCPQGWRHWKEFVDAKDSGKIGRGCE